MDTVNLQTFETFLTKCINKVVDHHRPLKVDCGNGKSVIVISAEDWAAIQETIHLNSIAGYVESINEVINSARKEWINAKEIEL